MDILNEFGGDILLVLLALAAYFIGGKYYE